MAKLISSQVLVMIMIFSVRHPYDVLSGKNSHYFCNLVVETIKVDAGFE